ncbi:septal ring lytic transglycosylase RlpA family protein [Patescibacteria group bacterium]|nr:septal ring lytic transglycosylase RlpA family protein [Patescibacteria group bacterium]
MQRYIIFFIAAVTLLLAANPAEAASVHYSASQLSSAVIFQAYDGDVKIEVPAGQHSFLDIYVFKKSADAMPENVELVSGIYDYYILSPQVDDQAIFNLILKYNSDSIYAKHIYKWNYEEKFWQLQPSVIDLESQTVSALISGRKGKIAVFEAGSVESEERELSSADQLFTIKLPAALAGYQMLTKIDSFSNLGYPEEKARTSDIYQFDVKSGQPLDLTEPIQLTINFSSAEHARKAIYYWDNNQNSWIYLPSWTNYYENSVSAYIHLPFSRVALFKEEGQWAGEASWYAWRGGNYAASRDYPSGAQLKVTNITYGSKNFGKSVIVTINDYGPAEWTGRIIDLDKVAYSQIGYLKGGVMPVRVEEIE